MAGSRGSIPSFQKRPDVYNPRRWVTGVAAAGVAAAGVAALATRRGLRRGVLRILHDREPAVTNDS